MLYKTKSKTHYLLSITEILSYMVQLIMVKVPDLFTWMTLRALEMRLTLLHAVLKDGQSTIVHILKTLQSIVVSDLFILNSGNILSPKRNDT